MSLISTYTNISEPLTELANKGYIETSGSNNDCEIVEGSFFNDCGKVKIINEWEYDRENIMDYKLKKTKKEYK